MKADKDGETDRLGTRFDVLDWTLVLAKAVDLGWENLNIRHATVSFVRNGTQ